MTTLHRDGTCTYELYGHRYRVAELPDEHTLDVLQPVERRRIALHLASHGDTRAQAWLDEHPRREGAWASTPNDLRNRPAIRVTLSRDVLARLDALALKWRVPRSRAIERLVEEEAGWRRRRDDEAGTTAAIPTPSRAPTPRTVRHPTRGA